MVGHLLEGGIIKGKKLSASPLFCVELFFFSVAKFSCFCRQFLSCLYTIGHSTFECVDKSGCREATENSVTSIFSLRQFDCLAFCAAENLVTHTEQFGTW